MTSLVSFSTRVLAFPTSHGKSPTGSITTTLATSSVTWSSSPPLGSSMRPRWARWSTRWRRWPRRPPSSQPLTLIGQQLVGWTMYLCNNTTGHNHHAKVAGARGEGKKNGVGGGVSHFKPSSPIFDEKDRPLIWMSDAGLLAWVAVLTIVGRNIGLWNLFVYYGAPYLFVNNWLGMQCPSPPHLTPLCSANKSGSLDHLPPAHGPHPPSLRG